MSEYGQVENVFAYSDYKIFILKRARQPLLGRAANLADLAKALNIRPARLSQILRGKADLTIEQACAASEYFGMSHVEAAYLLALVSYNKSPSESARRVLSKQIRAFREQSYTVRGHIPETMAIPESALPEFYSRWFYSAIRLCTYVPQFRNPIAIAKRLKLPVDTVNRVLDFLVRNQLCASESGIYKNGSALTHVDDTIRGLNHVANWVQKFSEKIQTPQPGDLNYALPCAVSRKDAEKIRAEVLKLTECVAKIAAQSEPPEEVFSFVVGWFEL